MASGQGSSITISLGNHGNMSIQQPIRPNTNIFHLGKNTSKLIIPRKRQNLQLPPTSHPFFFIFFIFFHFLFFSIFHFSFMFFHVLSCSFMFFHVLSCSFMFFHVLSFSFIFFVLVGCSKSDFFGPQFRYDFSQHFKKIQFFGPSRVVPFGPSLPFAPTFFSLVFFFLLFI